MRRDIMKTVEHFKGAGELPAAYAMCFGEAVQLVKTSVPNEYRETIPLDGLYKAIETAFLYGFVLGSRAERNGAIKKRL